MIDHNVLIYNMDHNVLWTVLCREKNDITEMTAWRLRLDCWLRTVVVLCPHLSHWFLKQMASSPSLRVYYLVISVSVCVLTT